jgi:hypothetical protein
MSELENQTTIKTIMESNENDRRLIKQDNGWWREETDQELIKRLRRKYSANRKEKLSRYSKNEEAK